MWYIIGAIVLVVIIAVLFVGKKKPKAKEMPTEIKEESSPQEITEEPMPPADEDKTLQ